MRLIGTLDNENQAHRFTAYLKQQGISTNCEVAFDAQTGHLSYHLWIHDEDQIHQAAGALDRFKNSPSAPEFNVVAPRPTPSEGGEIAAQQEKAAAPQIKAPITSFFLSLCILIFLLNWYQEAKILTSPHPSGNLLMTPVTKALFFDLPLQIDELENQQNEDKPFAVEIKEEAELLNKMTFWHGAYDWFLDKMKGKDSSQDEGPLFYKIRQGQFWRLFTPVLLHGGLLHILFNMIWLWVLGIPIEQRIGFLKTLLLTLILGIGSNVCQYLMGGPFFLGYSGIVVGLAGFIWAREKIAPWEGYPLTHSTILFLLLFVGGMFAIQFVAFGLQLFTNIAFSPNIANTGHISGGLIGMLLGRTSFFAMRPK